MHLDIKIATSKGQHIAHLLNPVADDYDMPISEKTMSVLEPILAKIPGLTYKHVILPGGLWSDGALEVTGWLVEERFKD